MKLTRFTLLLLALCATAPIAAESAAAPKSAAKTGPPSVLPWIHDDYAGALKQARARKVPMIVEAWAPW
ncbi:MAG: hypothetical protein HZB25_06555 [Candidatus Eisenbacteria bacterium]|nr:hypothetical protein [Candidatus Eisenbacteria bacterium]